MKEYLEQRIREVLAAMGGVPEDFEVQFQEPARPEYGDLSTNAAMQLARPFRKSPRAVADEVSARLRALPLDPALVAAVDVAGPGFINFRYADAYLSESVARILEQGERYGRTGSGRGRRAIVEYVSANPTGPLTVGHGRNAVLGDTIANLLDWIGFEVTREYYFNDAGRQMRVLGESVRARYRELLVTGAEVEALASSPEASARLEALRAEGVRMKPYPLGEGESVEVPDFFPEDGYLGEYIYDIARALIREHGAKLLLEADETVFKQAAEQSIFADIEATMRRIGVRMDSYFNEHSLYQSGALWNVLEQLRERGFVYEKDGATWFKTTAFGKEQDTVLVKSTGEPTYRLPDVAYHVDKLERGFDRIVDVFGADHIATYPDVLSAVRALGHDTALIDVVIYQFVTLVRSGAPVKMSTRKATYVTLDQLMDEVGEDVTRFFFLMRSPNTHLEFDLDLAKEAREKNPVFYLQYAHARICSIVRKAEETGVRFGAQPDLDRLRHPTEIGLMKELLSFPDVLRSAAGAKEPHRVITYLDGLATAFTRFYDACHILGEEPALATARMHLAQAARTVLRNGLTVLGISAPERM